MRRTTRLVSAVAMAAVAVPLTGVAPAAAADASESASSAGYFSDTGPQDTGTPAGTPMNVGTQVDGVAPGHLAVQGAGGTERKVSFLLFPGDGLQPGASVTSAVLTVPLAEGDGNISAGASPELVRVCAVDDTGFGGEDGAALAVAPKRLCDQFSAPAKASSDGKAYTFDITALAQSWTEANNGLALTVAEGANAPFQVVFQPGEQARLAYSASAPAGEDAAPAAGAGTGTDGSTGTGSGTAELPGGFGASTDTGSSDTGTGSEVLAAAPLTAPLDLTPVPTADVALAAESAPAPQTAEESAGGPVQRVVVREPSLTPAAPFWIGLGAAGALLALVSLVLGDSAVARPARSTSRLALALQARQRTTGGDRSRSLALGRA